MSTQTEKATEKINAIYDKLSIPDKLIVWENTGKHIHDTISEEQDKKIRESEYLDQFKNQLSKVITK